MDRLRPLEVNCGWEARVQGECGIEFSDDLMTWMRFEFRQRGINRITGEPVMCTEFVPHAGTRREFMLEYRAKLEE